MANNQKRERLDQPSRDTLSELDQALADLALEGNPQEGEFTMGELLIKAEREGKKVSRTKMQDLISNMISSGKWKCRKIHNKIYYKRIDN